MCRMRSGCLCWLFLVVVDIIRYEPPQMTGLPFSAAIPLGRSTTPSAVLAQPFPVVSVNAYSEWIWCMETLITYHMYLSWHCQFTSSLTSHGSLNGVIQFFSSLNQFQVLAFDTKISHFKRWWGILRANKYCWHLSLISIIVFFIKTVQLKTCLWIFPDPNFISNIVILHKYVPVPQMPGFSEENTLSCTLQSRKTFNGPEITLSTRWFGHRNQKD